MFGQLLVSGLMIGSIYALIALGYSLIYKSSGLMSFMQGDLLTLGAYVGLTFYAVLGLPFIISVILTVVLAFFFGILVEKGVIRKLLDKEVNAMYIILATIAISYIIQNGTQIVWGSVALYFPSIFPVSSVNVFGVNVQPEALMCMIVAVVAMIVLHLFVTKTKFGTAMRAASMDSLAAESVGIDTSLSTGVSWGLSAGLAAIGGILIGPIYGVYSMLGATIGNKGFAGAVMGGFGNMLGAVVGGLLLGLIETFVTGYISSSYRNLVAYTVLIIFLFVKPTGIFNEEAIKDV